MDLGKGVPCYRTASAMAKRQDLSLVCLGNNQEGAGPSQVWGLRLELGLWQTDCPELALPFSRSRAQGSPEGGDHSLAGGARADVARPREPGCWPWSAGAKDPACPAGAPASPACLYPFLFQGPPAIFRLFLTQPSCLYRRWTEWGCCSRLPASPSPGVPAFWGAGHS